MGTFVHGCGCVDFDIFTKCREGGREGGEGKERGNRAWFLLLRATLICE